MSSSIMEVEITPQVIKEHGLKPDEYDRICKILGRKPNITELGTLFGHVERTLWL